MATEKSEEPQKVEGSLKEENTPAGPVPASSEGGKDVAMMTNAEDLSNGQPPPPVEKAQKEESTSPESPAKAGSSASPAPASSEIKKAQEVSNGQPPPPEAKTQKETSTSSETPAKAGSEKQTEKSDKKEKNFSLKIKPGYVLNERPSSLPPLPEILPQPPANTSGKNNKRPKRQRLPKYTEKFCLAILRGETCSYGGTCKYSHDLKELLAERQPDIPNWTGGCPHFNLYGFCMYGASCRVGSSHLNLATGESMRKELDEPVPPQVTNTLNRDLQIQLRKKKYPFKCQRSQDKKKKGGGGSKKETPKAEDTKSKGDETAATTTAEVDMSPLPSKTRKLIDFSGKVYVAPLTTVGNLPFRRIMKQFGADITCGEMAMGANLLAGQPSEWALLKRHRSEDVFGVQIAAGFPDMFTRVSELLVAHTDVDFVDLNLGCPLDLVCNKGCGASLMKRENRLKESLLGITKNLSCPVTIKMRTGLDIAKPFAHELVPKIQSWGIDGIAAIMVHGRSRLQRYAKVADWDYISRVAVSQSPDLPQIPVLGNGDIFSYSDYEEKVARDGISSCAMLARGALIKPWLPTEIKERRHWDISASERLDILRDFCRFGLEHWGSDQQGVNKCRRFLLEWLSFLHRYVPLGLLEAQSIPQHMNQRPPLHLCGRNDLETLFLSGESPDWVRISEMLLGPVPEGFYFEPKHKAKSYATAATVRDTQPEG